MAMEASKAHTARMNMMLCSKYSFAKILKKKLCLSCSAVYVVSFDFTRNGSRKRVKETQFEKKSERNLIERNTIRIGGG